MAFLVQKAAVNLLAGKAEVQYNPDVTGPRHLIHAVQDAGFEAQLLRGDRHVSTLHVPFACINPGVDPASTLHQCCPKCTDVACLTFPWQQQGCRVARFLQREARPACRP